MDYGALPPEVNSARIYAGPGAAPMLAAATAWDRLAGQLDSAATDYAAAATRLSAEQWLGPAAESMAAAVLTQVAWLIHTAGLAEQTASQAKAAAAAFGAAFATTVPPPIIAANRYLRASLVATNTFGQNTPAIATTEAEYAEMWAQDAGAMYEYAAASARAATLTPFSPPAAAMADLPQPAALPALLQSLGLTPPLNLLSPANTVMGTTSLANAYAASESASQARTEIMNVGYEISATEDQILARLDQLGAPRLTGAPAGSVQARVTAGMAAAGTVGGLSVPPGWAAAPALRSSVSPLPHASLRGDTFALGRDGILGPLASIGAATVGCRVGTAGSPPKPDTLMRPAATGPVATLAADLYELARLRDCGILTDEEFSRHKGRLLAQ
ncbi:PPE family protein, SVP subgroup [Mycobacterium asiaticum]|uniref:PPE family domain-containing protein n=1 Tax=Mycobacterium asiaticum TaxID=1790 RepID=A0A1A3KZ35_MYCAS|nr:PPE domain-containing protein [Mycobacterium asiaticum]OBJ90487.1 hypothetical protein A5640_24430 [Mycobacterium asiaticum]